ncbi:MAG: helix-turn-helix domain-containing protein [Corallococcus sp.]|nr:helix-turn-helix domain-containing protein [Corallococcus sp.]MCM1358946.1 helix-turn-helix domain-containing protein [Corallococcus sp.]MCM1394934.1 helix-turn-helix domain-containing protein [Corallococcus sp.]
MEEFAKRLKELRKERKLSQAALALETGLTQSAVASWEVLTNVPSAEAIIVLAKYFGVTTDYLLGLED